jgi:transcriptional regulator with XRE-family HTH domain
VEREELADFLRQARRRVSPDDVGLPAGTRRRVAGLRREEVAQLASISVDYVVRLEQGRGPHPSDAVLSSLARALRLNDDERVHMFNLAGSAPPRPGRIDGLVRASTLRVLERLVDLPALVLDAKGDVLAWNAQATALLGDFSAWPPPTRNIVWRRFLGKDARVAASPQEDERTGIESVASLRLAAARYPDDPGLQRLLEELRGRSARFARWWDEARPAERRSSSKTVRHPELGVIELDCDALHLPDTDQRMIVYSAPPNSPAADALALLRVVGLQQLDRLDSASSAGSYSP